MNAPLPTRRFTVSRVNPLVVMKCANNLLTLYEHTVAHEKVHCVLLPPTLVPCIAPQPPFDYEVRS